MLNKEFFDAIKGCFCSEVLVERDVVSGLCFDTETNTDDLRSEWMELCCFEIDANIFFMDDLSDEIG